MSTAFTGLTSKAATNHANTDRDETIDYKNMPTNIWEQCDLKSHPVSIIIMKYMELCHQNLMLNKNNTKQKWRTVEYLALGTGNTTKHDGQTYMIMSDGTLYGHFYYQLTKNKSIFLTGAPKMTEWNPKACFKFCMMMEKDETINRVWIFPYYGRRWDSPSRWGFLCANQNDDTNAYLPLKYRSKIGGWGVQIMAYLRKILPKEANDVLDQCGTDEHQTLQLFHLKFHPIHSLFQTYQFKTIPVQGNLPIANYTSNYM